MRRATAWSLGFGAALACEPASSRCGDGTPEIGVFCFPDRGVVHVGHGFAPESMAVLDLDGDGALDLAAVNPSRQTLSVTWGSQDGSFERLTSWPIGEDIAGLAHGDLDGDGQVDLATALPNTDAVAVLYHRSGREFALRRHATGDTPRSILALDLDGGAAELVTANLGDGSLSVLRVGIADPPTIVGPGPHGLAAGDLDGDGNIDLAVTLREDDAVQVMRNSGGVLVPGARYEVGLVPGAVVIGDVDGDGALDLATADELGDTVSVVLGDGAGGAREQLRWPVMRQPDALVLVRGGGVPPVLGVLSSATSEVLRLDPRDGSTQPGSTVSAAGGMAAGDLDRDGREEIVVGASTSGTVSSLVSGVGIRLSSQWQAPPVRSIEAVDLGGDGVEEMVVAFESGDLAIWRGPEDALTAEPMPSGFAHVQGMARGDLDGDGLDDLILWGGMDEQAPVALRTLVQRDGGFQATDTYVESTNYLSSPLIGDVGGDGLVDVVLTMDGPTLPKAGGLVWLPGDGTGFVGAPVLIDERRLRSLAPLDLDGDAALDLAARDPKDEGVVLLFEDIAPDRSPNPLTLVKPGVSDLTAGDLDGDGIDDLLLCGSDGSMTRIADPVAAPGEASILAEDGCAQLGLRDLDGDGDLDVLATDYDSSVGRTVMTVLRNDGAGVLTGIGDATIVGRGPSLQMMTGAEGQSLLVDAEDEVEMLGFAVGPVLIEVPRAELGGRSVGMLGDLDGDARPDWWVGTTMELAVGFGHDGGIGPTQHVPIVGLVEAEVTELAHVTLADLEGDGTDELITLGVIDNPVLPLRSLSVVRVDVQGEFRGDFVTRIAGEATTVLARDLDGDRRTDLLVLAETTEGLAMTRLLGRGDGSFDPAVSQQLPVAADGRRSVLAELDGDDRLDLVIVTSFDVIVARGQDGGDFDAPRSWWQSSVDLYDIAPGHFDGDRQLDLVVTSSSGLLLLRGSADGTLGRPRVLLEGSSLFVDASDLDGDGVEELLLTDSNFLDRKLLRTGRSTGDGNFVFTSRDLGVGRTWYPNIAARDLDGDGAPEIVLLDGGSMTILRQQP